jgi:hypothetical protein
MPDLSDRLNSALAGRYAVESEIGRDRRGLSPPKESA